MIKRIAATVFVIIALVGCEKNPILGKWESKPTGKGSFSIKENWHFEKDQATYNGMLEEVDYEIDGDRIIVKGQSDLSKGLGVNSVFYLVDNRTLKKTDFSGRDIYYNRTQWE